jgi:peptidoglycan/LPS O-acetylase OafA/YrhL
VRVLSFGRFGVDLFFVLSGFLITGILLESKKSPNYFSSFYIRRTLRIFPLHYAVIALFLIGLPLVGQRTPTVRFLTDHQIWLWGYATNVYAAMIRGWPWGPFMHFWSLAIEEHFYLVWPLVVFLTSRRGLVAACACFLVGTAVMRWVLIDNQVATYSLTVCRLDGLAFGSLVAVVARDEGALRWLRRFVAPALITLGPATVAAYALPSEKFPWLGVVLLYTIADAFFAAVLLAVLFAPAGSRAGRFFRSGALQTFGKYSYGVYVFHMMLRWAERGVVFRAVSRVIHVEGLATLGYGVVMTALSLGLAFVSYHAFEKHFLGLKSRFSARAPGGAAYAGTAAVAPPVEAE